MTSLPTGSSPARWTCASADAVATAVALAAEASRHRGVRTGRLAALLLAAILVVAGCADRHRRPPRRSGIGGRIRARSRVDAAGRRLRGRAAVIRFRGALPDRRRSDGAPGLGRVHRRPGLHRPPCCRALQPGAVATVRRRRSTGRWCPRCPRVSPPATTRRPRKTNPCCWWRESTAKAWGGSDVSADLSTLPKHCDGLVVGTVTGRQAPSAIGTCRLPAAARIPRRDNDVRCGAGRAADCGVDHDRRPRHARPTWSRWPTASPR